MITVIKEKQQTKKILIWSFEKINKIGKSLTRQTKETREKALIINIRNNKGYCYQPYRKYYKGILSGK